MVKSLAEKIAALDKSYDALKTPGYSIHDVIEIGEDTYVIWSDAKGYSVAWRDDRGNGGCSGAYPDIFRAINYINNDSISAFREQEKRKENEKI